MANPLLLDPTRTTGIVRRWFAELSRRFSALEQAIYMLVVIENAFGIGTPLLQHFIVVNSRWQFLTDVDKLSAFQSWFQEQVDDNLLEVDTATGDPWTARFTDSAYRQGVLRAFTDARRDLLTEPSDFFEGSKEEFLRAAFGTQTAVGKIKLVATRAFEELKGVSAQMAASMNRVLADGLAHGKGVRQIARALVNESKLGRKRALLIARTETVHAHAEGQLDALEALGVEEVGLQVEWSTAGDGKVCKKCKARAGTVMSVKAARGLIPFHPGCRCAWIPANVGEKRSARRAVSR